MKAINIVSTHYFDSIKDDTMHMALAQHIRTPDEMKTPLQQKYTEFYKAQAKDGKFVILDNGTCEGMSVNFDNVIRRAQYIGAKEIVLPDIFNNMKETKESILKGLDRAHFLGVYDDFKWMAVCHGKNATELYQMMFFLNTLPVQTIGIPKIITKNLSSISARIDLVASAYLEGVWSTKEIHLLGSSDSPLEALQASVWSTKMSSVTQKEDKSMKESTGWIRSIDSAVPFIFAMAGMLFSDGLRPNEKINLLSYNGLKQREEQCFYLNLVKWRDYAEGVESKPVRSV